MLHRFSNNLLFLLRVGDLLVRIRSVWIRLRSPVTIFISETSLTDRGVLVYLKNLCCWETLMLTDDSSMPISSWAMVDIFIENMAHVPVSTPYDVI